MPTEKQYKVLLIDDSAEDRAMYCRYLQRGSSRAYQILEADSAAVGLDLYHRSLPDVVLLDYSLPDMDGLDLLAVLPQNGKQRIPVLMVTGQGHEAIAVQAIKSGAEDYLIKGNLTANELCRTLDRTIEQFQLRQQLQQQQQQQHLISTIALSIRQSLQLEEILETTVTEVQQFLNADRVMIYKFRPDMSGTIITESVLPGWSVTLNQQIQDICFQHNRGGNYRTGKSWAIDNVYQANLTPCHLQLLEQFEVKANLVAPILVGDELWGLLIAHQCSDFRQWQSTELDLLNALVTQIAIAIQQATAYQQAKAELEKRQQIEAILRKSEQRYATLTEMSPVGMFQTDAEGHCLYANERWYQIAGLTSAEAAGFGWVNGIHPDDRDLVSTEWYAAVQANRPFRLEYRFQNAAGQITWVFGQATAERGVSGEIVGYVGTITDINDRKQAEAAIQQLNQDLEQKVAERTAALQASEATNRAMLEAVPDLLLRLGRDGTCPAYIQPSVKSGTFLPIHNNLSEVLPATLLQQQLQVIETAIETRELQVYEHQFLKQGRMVYEEIRVAALNDSEVLAIVRDISDRKQTEQALTQYAHEVEDLYNNAPCGYQSLDGKGRIITINNTELQWLGYTRAELLGESFAAIITDASLRLFQQQYPEFKRRGWVQDLEFDLVCKDGSVFPVFLSATAVKDTEGNYLYSRSTLFDARDRKQFEASLKQYERIVSSTKDGIALLDRHYTYQVANQAYLTWCNKSYDGVIGHSVRDVLGSELFDNFIQPRLDQCLAGKTVQYEKWFDYPNVVPQFLSVTYTPYLDVNQTIAGIIVSLRDLTVLKQAEQELTRRQDLHEAIFNESADALFLVDPYTLLTLDCNRRAIELFGAADKAELIGVEGHTFQRYQFIAQDLAAIVSEMETEGFWSREIEYVTRQGDFFWGNIAAKPIAVAGRTMNLVRVTDITDRKQAEEALRESEEFNKRILESSSDCIKLIDLEGRLQYMNAGGQCIMEVDNFSCCLNAEWVSLWPEAARPDLEAAITIAKTGRMGKFQGFCPTAKGTPKWWDVVVTPMQDEAGQVTQFLAVSRDITVLKQAEVEFLQTTAQLEASNKELEAFAYSVSHDLRSPLRAIDGFSRALLEDYGDQFGAEGKDYFDRIRHNVGRMGTLIDDLLNLSRVSRSEMQYNAVNLSTLVQEQLHELQALEPERQVIGVVAPGAIVSADATLMRVVISNLLQNAWKFTSHHATAHIEFGIMQREEQSIYFIRDDGAGFDMAYANMLFGVFQRLHNTHEFPGTGIGLATVQRAIHRHGGKVWAEGAVEQGATFYFTVPHSHLQTGA